jgi:hypothetical protein
MHLASVSGTADRGMPFRNSLCSAKAQIATIQEALGIFRNNLCDSLNCGIGTEK